MKYFKIILFGLIFTFVLSCKDNTEQIKNYESRISALEQQLDSFSGVNHQLNEEISVAKNNQWFGIEQKAEILKNLNIENPEKHIEDKLREQTEILPLKAVLGGTMTIDHIVILNEDWIIANYSDGHVYGESIIQYKIDKNGKLKFKVLLSKQ